MTGQKILHNVSTIAPLNQGVYGLYNSAENKKVIGPAVANKIKFKFNQNTLNQTTLDKLPNNVIKQHLPDIDINQIKPSVVIHVNVNKIVRELGDTKEAVIEIASTIIHEATHDLEYQSTGKTNEVGPKNAESKFRYWVNKNWNFIVSKIPQLSNL
jgi:PBP1b-binding outer membrane lipoprotein LpoB